MSNTDDVPLPRMLKPRELQPLVPRAPEAFMPPTERDRLHKLANELDRSKLDEIGWRFRNLNYGEIKEFCEKTASDIDKVWQWATEQKAD